MRIYLVLVTWAFAFMASPALGCSCVSPPPGVKTEREVAKWYADRSDTIFEGTVERVELKGSLIEAKVGSLVSADMDEDYPFLQVTFDVWRSYRGVEQKNAVVTTGLGGGDCGFDFEVGKQYLIYANEDAGHLSTGICSGTALLEESRSNLAYLRGEQPFAGDSTPSVSMPTARLCGRVLRAEPKFADSQVFILRIGSTPIPSDEADLAQDGSFSFSEAEPGRYYLAFMTRANDDSPRSFVFFPGVFSSSEATPIGLKSGQDRSELLFNVPPRDTFSVSGNVLTSNKSALPADCKVFLMNADPSSFLVSYMQDVGSSGYFDFPRVLAGKYWAFAEVESDTAPNWLTRKTEVEVEAGVSHLSLELVQK